ncbi:MAG: hypothetical protein KDA80_16155 [Planctomycetaceae bacterium]|nr:hypothetical protein [Planctomycetaceae bacterium]
MSVGILEILFVVVVSLVCCMVFFRTAASQRQNWWLAVPVFFLIAALTSPADLLSTLLIGALNTGVCWAFHRVGKHVMTGQST